MKYNLIFNKVPMKVPNRAGHNMSHENLFTAKCGTLTPFFVEPVFPNEKHSVSVSAHVQLPPFVTDVYGRIDAVWELFFVPNRLLYGGWQEFITYQTNNSLYPSGTPTQSKPKYLPKRSVALNTVENVDLFSAGSLSDYLGFKIDASVDDGLTVVINNILPYLAYHKIWDDWYRSSTIQKSCFFRQGDNTSGVTPAQLPYLSFGGDSPYMMNSSVLADSVSFLSLRQRLWAKDYFTNSTPLPQNGEPFSLQMTPDSSGKVSFNMNQLYSLNALQQFSIRHNIAGNRYADNIFSNWGCYPSDAIVDRSLYLGRKIVPIYTKSVYQNAQDSSIGSTSQNPFTTVGAKYGSPQGVGSGKLVSNFKTTEHGFLFGIFSLVPRPYYSSGIRRYLRANKQSDFPFPILHGIGDQPIYVSELMDKFQGDIYSDDTFGYSQYASEYKFHPDEVHGLLRDGQSLESFAIQRSFSTVPSLGSAFLEIPTNFLDQVTAINGQVSQYGCWVNAHINYKKASPLQPYTIPTLGDMENTHTIMVDKGGKRL